MKRFAKSYAVCLFLTGLLLVLCMGCPAGMVLLVLLKGNPLLFWVLAALFAGGSRFGLGGVEGAARGFGEVKRK